jgi:hypothetical protein
MDIGWITLRSLESLFLSGSRTPVLFFLAVQSLTEQISLKFLTGKTFYEGK